MWDPRLYTSDYVEPLTVQRKNAGGLSADLKDLQDRIFKLESCCYRLDEDHAALCDYLQAIGYIRPLELQLRQRVRRFVRIVEETFQAPGLVLKVGHCTGMRTARMLSMVSRRFYDGVRGALPTLSAWLMPKIYVCGGRRDGSSLSSVERFDLNTGIWEAMPPMPTARYGCAAASLDACLYIFGGHAGGPMLDSAEVFDPACGRWESLATMPTPRTGCTVAAMRGQLYVIGGFDGRQPMATVERFNPKIAAGTPSSTASLWPPWEVMPDMHWARYGCASEVMGGYLYVVGGHGSKPLPVLERFKEATHEWSEVARMPTARHSCACIGAGGQLHVFGGFDGRQALRSAERFDPHTGRWFVLAQMPSCRYEFAAAGVAGDLYIFGGHDGRQAQASCLRFRLATNQWSLLQAMPAARGGCAGAALGVG